jgi:glycosyltransferase involved in cell wall biosynthesis
VLSSEVARLVPVDADAFAAAMADLIDRPDERARLSRAAASLAAEKYSRESYVRRTAEAYRRLVGADGAGSTGRANEDVARNPGWSTK